MRTGESAQVTDTQLSATAVDSAFIRRAVELADLNAVRVTLFQLTDDPELAALPPAAELDEPTRELLINKAVGWLEKEAGPRRLSEPPEAELRRLMNMATGEQMPDLEFQARKDLPAFKDFPWMADWTDGKRDLPDGFQVAIVGSGFSGIAMGVQLEILGIPYVILERREEPGGTWNVNRYPDVRVDTISITYEYSFEKNYPWSEYFGRGAEVRKYLDFIAKKYGTRQHTLFGHDLKQATYNEAASTWTLEVETPAGTKSFVANMLVNAVGTFANPKFPHFEAQETFEGTIMHPARWDEDLDLTGKRVAVIGNGSTGVQLLAPVAAAAEQVFVFQRTPQWISPRDRYGKPVEPEIRWLLDNFPGYWNWWHYMAIAGLFQTHRLLILDEEWKAQGGMVNPANDKLRDDLKAYITAQTGGRQDLIDKLVPDYAPFSRRAVVDNGWYRALTRDNVQLVTDDIARLIPKGIETADGTVHEVDVIVTATGYDVIKYLWPADYVGVDGLNLHEFWSKDGPRAYLGMMVPNFPNMFTLYGPNSQAVSGGSALPSWYVIWSAYAAQCIVRAIEQRKTTVEVKAEAYQRYNDALDEESKNLLIMKEEGAPEKNYYVNEFGRLQVNVPWYGPEYHRMCTEIAWEDIDIS
jgi:4-hydroxyacetophenone monooxygenase